MSSIYGSSKNLKLDSLETQRKISNIIDKLVNAKAIDRKREDAAKVCLACLLVGSNKEQAKKVAKARNFEKFWRNLKKSGYFNDDGTVNVDKDFDKNGISFILMILAAEGLINAKFGEVSE